MPHRHDIESAAEAQVLRHPAQVHRHHQQIRDQFCAFRLEMVLGHPERVVAALIHALGVLDDLVQRAAQFRLRIAALVDRGAGVPEILHVDCSVIGAIEFRNHRLALADAGVDCHLRRRFRLAEISLLLASGLAGINQGSPQRGILAWLRSGNGMVQPCAPALPSSSLLRWTPRSLVISFCAAANAFNQDRRPVTSRSSCKTERAEL